MAEGVPGPSWPVYDEVHLELPPLNPPLCRLRRSQQGTYPLQGRITLCGIVGVVCTRLC